VTEREAVPDTRGPVARPGGHGERGRLIVLEGIDRSGRSTHAGELERHLRYRGHGVLRTSLGTSMIAAGPLRRIRDRGSRAPEEVALLYAADLAERIDQVVVPSLRAGLVVLADRYVYTPMARAEAREVDPDWLDGLFAFAPAPDLVLFLEVDPATSLARWGNDPPAYEAGLDLGLSDDLRESYQLFQGRLAAAFDRYAGRYGFTRVAAAGPVPEVQSRIERVVEAVAQGPSGVSR
jgi:dTMP kinase